MITGDDLDYNPFYQALQVSYPSKYTEALKKCYVLCIPKKEVLHRIPITEELVDCHILRPSPYFQGIYLTTHNRETRTYEIHDREVIDTTHDEHPRRVKVTGAETGYNQDMQSYQILIIERPLYPHCDSPRASRIPDIDLDQKITSLVQARKFLNQFLCHENVLRQLDDRLGLWKETSLILVQPGLDEASNKLQTIVQQTRIELLKKHGLSLQQDPRFQNLITVALECYVMDGVWDVLFPAVCKTREDEDRNLYERCCRLGDLDVSADQLGVHPDFCVPTPAAVVELASLDSLKTPLEKLLVLRTSLDLIVAEIKGALVDYTAKVCQEESPMVPVVSSDDLLPLLVTVLAKVRPFHLSSTLLFCERFQWSLGHGSSSLQYCLVTFSAAAHFLKVIRPETLIPSDRKLKKELSFQELVAVTDEVEEAFSPHRRRSCAEDGDDLKTPTPMDRQLQRVMEMIEKSTQDLQLSENIEMQRQEEEKEALRDVLGTFKFRSCIGRQTSMME